VWDHLKRDTRERIGTLSNAVHEALRADPALEAEELETGRRELLRAQKGALLTLRRDRVITEEVFENLSAEMDAALMAEAPVDPALTGEAPVDPAPRSAESRESGGI
jgi:hypothetical protein